VSNNIAEIEYISKLISWAYVRGWWIYCASMCLTCLWCSLFDVNYCWYVVGADLVEFKLSMCLWLQRFHLRVYCCSFIGCWDCYCMILHDLILNRRLIVWASVLIEFVLQRLCWRVCIQCLIYTSKLFRGTPILFC